MGQTTRKCVVDGCQKTLIARGWCSGHYQKWRRHGDPEVTLAYRDGPEGSFMNRTKRQGDCLVWTGFIDWGGYGKISNPGGSTLAHRYAWERVHGSVPEGLFVDHICHNRACVNVEHLRLATRSQNAQHRSGVDARNKSSGVRNVYRNGNKWIVRMQIEGSLRSFGNFDTIDEASEVATSVRQNYFGEFAGKG